MLSEILKTATLKTLSQKLKAKEFSATELLEAYIKRVNAVNSKTNAFITLCEETAFDAAKSADKTIAEGKATTITGIPLGVKDNICTNGIKTTAGSKMLADFIPPYDATVIARLKNSGAVILGKTNMDEFAMGGSSQTSFFGGVCNPYDLSRVAGGSSGGSAASVAAALCPAALGSDTGGSVRQPAAFCGITGLKPTYSTVSRYGLIAFASSFDQIGPMAKTAEDCGILLHCIAGFDNNDFTTKGLDNIDYTAKIGKDIKGLVIGLPKEFFGDEIDAEYKQAVLNAAKYYEKMGCVIKEVSLPSLKYAVSAYYLISSAEAASNLSRYDGIKFGYRSENGKTYEEIIKNTRREGFGDEVKRRIMLGNYALSSGYYDKYYSNAVKIRSKIKAEYDAIFKECDVILTPTAPSVAYKIGTKENNPAQMYLADICTVTANITGLPAVCTTCGYDKNGMPISFSLTGRAFDEATILGAADNFERSFERREAQI